MNRPTLFRTALAAFAGAASIGLATAQEATYDTGTRATLPGSNSGSVTPDSPMERTPRPGPAEPPETGAPDEPYRAPSEPAARTVDPGNMTSPTDPEAGAIQIEGQTAPANPVE